MENIFFLVLVAVVGLIRWIMVAAENKKNTEAAKRAVDRQPNAPVERAPAQSEEERIRKFMEALGVPTTTAPPGKTPPREVVPKTPRPPRRQILPVDPFPAPRAGAPLAPATTTSPPFVVPPVELPAPRTVETTVATAPTTVRVERERRTAPDFEVGNVEWRIDDPLQLRSMETVGTLGSADLVAPEITWAQRLATPEGLRDAVILREIFGPPRSMQPLEQRAVA